MKHSRGELETFFRGSDSTLADPVFQNADVDWDTVIEQAYAGFLLPALAARVHNLGLDKEISQEISHVFNAAEELNRERNRVILQEAEHVCLLLNQIDIQPLALKGLAYLIEGVYPDPALRYLADLDLLVPEHQLTQAIAGLRQNGYSSDDSDVLVEFRHHSAGMQRAGLPIIELHHRVGIGVCERILTSAELLAQAKPVRFGKAQFLIPSPTHLVTHLVLHSQLAHPYHDRIFPPLRALHDLMEVHSHYQNQIDWDAVSMAYKRVGQSATLLLHLCYAHQAIGFCPLNGGIPDAARLSAVYRLRWQRRLLLNRHPALRFIDPFYLFMSVFSRRARLLPEIAKHPECWATVLGRLKQADFYRQLLGA